MTTSGASDEASTTRTPPLVYSALVFALLGFACGLPAVIGLILGIIGYRQATAVGAGIGLAKAAIVVSGAWLVIFLLIIVVAQFNGAASSG